MLIADKFEAVYSVPPRDLVHVSAKAYTVPQILEMEMKILHALDFRVVMALACDFLHRYIQVSSASDDVRDTASYVAVEGLQHIHIVADGPHLLAAASLALARRLRGQPVWVRARRPHSHFRLLPPPACL